MTFTERRVLLENLHDLENALITAQRIEELTNIEELPA